MTDLENAVRDVLEWAEQMGGWEAPCWDRLKRALNAQNAGIITRYLVEVRYGETADEAYLLSVSSSSSERTVMDMVERVLKEYKDNLGDITDPYQVVRVIKSETWWKVELIEPARIWSLDLKDR